jgi:uncharacterized membrane protein
MSFGIRSWAINAKKCSISNSFIVILAVISVLTRFFWIGRESLWLDEAASITLANSAGIQEAINHLQYATWLDQHPIFYYFILHYWIKFFGTSEIALRSLSAIFGIAIIIFTYYVGKELIGKNIGFLASILVLANPTNLYYSQEARMYTLTSLLILVSTYFFFESLSKQNARQFLCYVLTSTILIYTDYIGLLVLGIHLLFGLLNVLIQKNAEILEKLLVAFTAILILYSPWLPNLYSCKGATWMRPPTLEQAFSLLIEDIGIRSRDVNTLFGPVIPNLLFSLIIGIVLIILAAGIIQSLQNMTEFSSLVAMICIIPIIMIFISIYIVPIYNGRQISSFVPEIALMIAVGYTRMQYLTSKLGSYLLKIDIYKFNIFALILLIFIVINSNSMYVLYTTDSKEDWRGLAKNVAGSVQKNDVILINARYCIDPFNYYFKNYGFEEVYGVQNIDQVKLRVPGYKRVWLILLYNTITEKNLTDLLNKSEKHYEIKRKSYTGGIRLVRFDLS